MELILRNQLIQISGGLFQIKGTEIKLGARIGKGR